MGSNNLTMFAEAAEAVGTLTMQDRAGKGLYNRDR